MSQFAFGCFNQSLSGHSLRRSFNFFFFVNLCSVKKKTEIPDCVYSMNLLVDDLACYSQKWNVFTLFRMICFNDFVCHPCEINRQ